MLGKLIVKAEPKAVEEDNYTPTDEDPEHDEATADAYAEFKKYFREGDDGRALRALKSLIAICGSHPSY